MRVLERVNHLGWFFEEGKDLINEDLLKGIQPCSYVNLDREFSDVTICTAVSGEWPLKI